MNFTAADVKTLRERTNCGMMDCKNALKEADGDMEKAIEVLREKGLAKAAKKSGRISAEGVAYAFAENNVGVIIEVNSETDFVAKNQMFRDFVAACAKTVAECSPADVEALLDCKMHGEDKTVREALNEKILVIGENIKIRRFARVEGVVSTYIHGEGRIGVLVAFNAPAEVAAKPEFAEYGKDICMQVAAAAPLYCTKADVPEDVLDKEREIIKVQAMNEGKPAAIAEKMVMGRINKFYKEVCLTEQEFIKDSDLSVTKYTKNVSADLGGDIEIVSFIRFEKGEGLEKRSDNFADEVASMMK